VCPSKPIRPERQLIDLRIGDVVGGVEAYDGTEESPRAEDAGGERVDAGGRGGVNLGGVDGCQVGLYGVGYGDGGDLRGSSGNGRSFWGGERTRRSQEGSQPSSWGRKESIVGPWKGMGYDGTNWRFEQLLRSNVLPVELDSP